MHISASQASAAIDRSVLLLDNDALSRQRIGSGLASRGFEPVLADTVESAMAALKKSAPAFAVIDPHVSDGSGLKVIAALRSARPDACSIILTGYGSIASAVLAVKAGAIDYLSKPANAEDVSKALLAAARNEMPEPPENPISAARVRWEHIQRVYELCGHNVSETARRLRMHRRSLQRMLAKRAPN